MANPTYFDLSALRRRYMIHELHANGVKAEEIAERLQISEGNVWVWLSRPKPRLKHAEAGPEGWREDAACKDADTNLFFPPKAGIGARKYIKQAQAICATCPVIEQCRRNAFDHYETHGVWGGEDMSKYRYRYDEKTGDVYLEIGGSGGTLTKVS